jgi:hypothetical protein
MAGGGGRGTGTSLPPQWLQGRVRMARVIGK